MDPLVLAICLYFVALLLAILDVFLPSGGILLILSGLAALGSIYSSFQYGTTTGLVMSTIVLGTVPVLVYSAIRIWPHTPIGRRILLSPSPPGDTASSHPLVEWIGSVVVAQWPLAPMGQVKIGVHRFNAMSSDGRLIEAGQRIKVIGLHEGLLVVAPTSEPLSITPASPSVESDRSVQGELSNGELLETPAKQLGLDSLEELPLDDDSPISDR